jgi:hypothetical protein
MAILRRFAAARPVHVITAVRRGHKRAIVEQSHDQLTGGQGFGGALDSANPAGAVGGFGLGDFDCGVEFGLVELHGVSFRDVRLTSAYYPINLFCVKRNS